MEKIVVNGKTFWIDEDAFLKEQEWRKKKDQEFFINWQNFLYKLEHHETD